MSNVFRRGPKGGQAENPSREEPLFRKGVRPSGDQGSTLEQIASSFEPRIRTGDSVGFGEPVTVDELLGIDGLVDHLLQTNTFIQGKLGFHEHLIAIIHQRGQVEPDKVRYARKSANLPRGGQDRLSAPEDRVVIVPVVESVEALNKFVADALTRVKTVWVVAPLLSIQTHLLLSFANFLLLAEPEEIEALQDLVNIPSKKWQIINERRLATPILVTNYKPLLERYGAKTITIIPLEIDF